MLWTYELVMVNYCDFHIAVTDVPLCLWNTGAPLAGNTGFICPLSRSVSTKQSGWLYNLSATNCVVNQISYFSPLYAFRHQTSLWRRQRIYSVQFPQTAQSLLSRPSPSFLCKHCVANGPDHTAQPAATSSPQWLWSTGVSPASGDANTMWFLSAVIQPSIASIRPRQIGWW